MNEGRQNGLQGHRITDQREITTTALEIIRAVNQRRGKPMSPRDRMALKLLTPMNSALVLRPGERSLGCRQVSFDIITDDFRRGQHRLIPIGIHVNKPDRGWLSEKYGQGRFLWNLHLKEDSKAGLDRILSNLFKMKRKGLFGSKADIQIQDNVQSIAGRVGKGLNLLIQRQTGAVETSLRRLVNAEAIYRPQEVGLRVGNHSQGQVMLLFGKNKRLGISFLVQRL